MKEILNNGLGKVEGLFTFSHLIYVVLAILIVCFFVFFDLKKDKALIEKKIIIIGISLCDSFKSIIKKKKWDFNFFDTNYVFSAKNYAKFDI